MFCFSICVVSLLSRAKKNTVAIETSEASWCETVNNYAPTTVSVCGLDMCVT